MTNPIPFYLSDPDYFTISDPKRKSHLSQIKTRNQIAQRIRMSTADKSYSVTITRKDITHD